MTMKTIALAKKSLVAGALLAGAAAAIAADAKGGPGFAISWDSADSAGGGTSSRGAYTVVDSIGQHDAGPPMTGGQFAVQDGFLALQEQPPILGDVLVIE